MSEPEFKLGDRVIDSETGMVGTVVGHWWDDTGQWVTVEWDRSALRANEVSAFEEDVA